ncbi:hypothetical protein P692DRAFT_20956500 [Suillus brevipes Sb2]|nr:hypothetical protein P692DRAFT_20956500 [Suillus brevipes Sb2]
MIPFPVRLVQSLRRYKDSKLPTHLINAGKYGMGIVYYFCYYLWRRNELSGNNASFILWCISAVIYSLYGCAWDFAMDWSICKPHAKYRFLRRELVYTSQIPMYYVALVTNFIIRFLWVFYICTRLAILQYPVILVCPDGDDTKSCVVLPVSKKRTAFEEAMWEENSEAHALDRELFIQYLKTLRVYRPRLVPRGPAGMGQGYLGAAALHHLEGYHVQTLDLGTLLGDSTRTVEAAVVQLFVEAKRHQPSVIYLPSLDGWLAAVSETARSTVRSMLDPLAPTDPVLVLAIVDGPFSSLPRDIRSWFGMTRENRLTLPSPTEAQREAFFSSIIAEIHRPPNQFADGIKRRKRILEELQLRPRLSPVNRRLLNLLFKKRTISFKRFTEKAREEYDFDPIPVVNEVEIIATTVTVQAENDVVDICEQVIQEQPNGIVNGIHPDPEPIEHSEPPQPPHPPQPQLFDMDLERMHVDLYKGKYLTPHDFLEDINKIVFNAAARAHQDPTGDRLYRAQAMLTAAEVSIQDFDAQFKHECQRMAEQERKRREEHKKAKGKGRAGEDAQNGAAAPRRSARHNGQQLEITITDPLQLERRLKRAHSTERHSGSPESADPRKPAGFDPMLLNPMYPDGGFPTTSISHLLNGAGPSTVPAQDGCTPPPAPLLSQRLELRF